MTLVTAENAESAEMKDGVNTITEAVIGAVIDAFRDLCDQKCGS